MKAEYKRHLVRYDSLFDGFFEWFLGQYHAESGGFFHARSSFDLAGNYPDIESTTFAVDIMQSTGILSRINPRLKQSIIGFFQELQDPESGLFLDKNPKMAKDEVMVARAQSFSLKALSKLGARAKYPLPRAKNLEAYFASPKSMIAWMDSVELSNSWRGCDKMSSVRMGISILPQDKKIEYLKAAWDYLKTIQDESSGFWGQGRPFIRLSGTFKILAGFYRNHREHIPRPEKIVASVFEALQTDTQDDFCWVRNPVDILEMISPDLSSQDVLDLIVSTVGGVEALHRPDGGFSREILHSPAATNVAQVKLGEAHVDLPEPVILSKGLVESDMNAATQAEKVRLMLYQFAGLEPSPLIVPDSVLKTFNGLPPSSGTEH